jgi:hypothetical protein
MCAGVNNVNGNIDVPFSIRRDNMAIPLKVERLDFLLQALPLVVSRIRTVFRD